MRIFVLCTVCRVSALILSMNTPPSSPHPGWHPPTHPPFPVQPLILISWTHDTVSKCFMHAFHTPALCQIVNLEHSHWASVQCREWWLRSIAYFFFLSFCEMALVTEIKHVSSWLSVYHLQSHPHSQDRLQKQKGGFVFLHKVCRGWKAATKAPL